MIDLTDHFLLAKSVAVLRMRLNATPTRGVTLSRLDATRLLEAVEPLAHLTEEAK